MSSPQCCSNPPALNPSAGAGHVEKLGGLHSYVTGSLGSKVTVLLVSDVFGFKAPILRKLADKVAAAGFLVVVPDFFYGDPYSIQDANRPLNVWIKDHQQAKGFEDAKHVLESLRSKGIALQVSAGEPAVELGKYDLIKAAVLCHPTNVTVDDITEVKAPISLLGGENDHRSPPELLKQFEEVLKEKSEIQSHVKIFSKVGHGWTMKYNVEDKAAVKAAEEAHQDLLVWFSNHVKLMTSSSL